MKKKVIVLIVLFVLGCLNSALAAQQMLPFRAGETWRVDQGNNSTPTHSGNLQYAWDFNLGNGRDDLGLPVLAPASGTIVYAKNCCTKWGNAVIIDIGNIII